jgi:hypothetical protein
MPHTIGEQIRGQLRLLTIATIFCYVIVVALGLIGARFSMRTDRELRAEENKTEQALCTLRHDLQDRVNASQDYLQRHPKGFPGVSAAILSTSIKGQQATIKSLSNLKCPPN